MRIQGFQKMTLLDYPNKVACTVFTAGCNFRCPFCHNALLVTEIENNEDYSKEEIFDYLKKRVGLLDGVCITGGEPLLQTDIKDFICEIKEMGYKVKLDTNGSFTDKLIQLVEGGYVDYVAMDVKNSKERYAETIGKEKFDLSVIENSVDYLLHQNKIDFEFRTTIVKEFHTIRDIENLAKWIKGANHYYLQNFVDSGGLIGENLHAVEKNTLLDMKNVVKPYISGVELRGV